MFKKINLAPGDVHLWRIILPINEGIKKRLKSYLSIKELHNFQGLNSEMARDRFLVSKGALKEVLACYLEMQPQNINFLSAPLGKPYLFSSRFHFNVSHSHHCILFGITRDIEIGVDVEFCNAKIDYMRIAKSFFSKLEYKKILTTPPKDRCKTFYQCWTAKEAVLKTIGCGLYGLISHQNINSSESDGSVILFDANIHEKKRVFLCKQAIIPEIGYVAAFATENGYKQVFFWDWKIQSKVEVEYF